MKSSFWRRAGRVSERMAIAVTAAVISPWSFWLLFALCLLQFISAKVATGVLYVSNDIQLLLLPLLGISGSVSAASAARRARAAHLELMKAIEAIRKDRDAVGRRIDDLIALQSQSET